MLLQIIMSTYTLINNSKMAEPLYFQSTYPIVYSLIWYLFTHNMGSLYGLKFLWSKIRIIIALLSFAFQVSHRHLFIDVDNDLGRVLFNYLFRRSILIDVITS